ncbi:CBS domain-containing protein [Dactylosporangium aurantiacum]|uniref:CBS domain-containing protein n=1 Tax=Dactylosporangium aurantiacum TaxID=35754 RepID=A0A9Q9IMY1_9ACTN|nr:CBS domain-containing protein [Dactylosporangium aurantiacum]MDG6105892.1 CBS domain-containing protein [Dactylosporangium aurantiacum]UWZ57933.1 CBS domain-containing protein [Dactylosporangium aurantiacum]
MNDLRPAHDLRVRDVMNPSVVVVTADCTSRHVVDVITEFGVSGVPVVRDDDRVIGMISEADLLPSLQPAGAAALGPADTGTAAGREPDTGTVARHGTRTGTATRHGTHADTAGALMTAPPVTVTAGAPVSTAAGLMQRHGVKRLPVLDDDTGILVGIVTVRDLLRGALRSDEAIERELLDELLVNGLRRGDEGVTGTVQDGVVTLAGSAPQRDVMAAIRIASGLDGVYGVVDTISAPGTLTVSAVPPAAAVPPVSFVVSEPAPDESERDPATDAG